MDVSTLRRGGWPAARAAFASATTPLRPLTASFASAAASRPRQAWPNAAWSPEPGSISGSTFVDWNRNGVRDAAEPGLPNVQISLSGSNTGSAVTDGKRQLHVARRAERAVFGERPGRLSAALSGNPTPLAVDLGSGEQRAGVDFPYTESTQPVCTATSPSGTPTRVDLTLRDGSGLRRVVVRTVSNFQVSVRGGAPVTSPTTVDFPTPAAGDVSVTATRGNAAQAATVELDVVDAFGNQVSCASSVPASTTPTPQPPAPPAPPKPDPPKPQPPKPEPPKPPTPGSDDPIRRELTGQGRFDIEVARHVAGSMRYVTIRNGRKGLESVEVFVNHRWFLSGRLHNGQVKTIDVSRALKPGTKNKIVLVGRGGRHDSAVVTISVASRNIRHGARHRAAPPLACAPFASPRRSPHSRPPGIPNNSMARRLRWPSIHSGQVRLSSGRTAARR